MVFWGKVFGAILGWMLAGPLGFVLGIIIGHFFDKGFVHNTSGTRQVFFDETFRVMGHVAKSDGRVSEREIQLARDLMNRLMLSPTQKARAIAMFTEGKQSDFDLSASLSRFKTACHHQQMLIRMFVEIQFEAARADGPLNIKKQAILKQICAQLGFAQNFRQESRAYTQTTRGYDPYAILGIKQSATKAEIKRAYRKLMSQHHPDKLVSKGLPEEMMKLATEKAQSIQKAYDDICKARGYP